jgi:hypothetical protein
MIKFDKFNYKKTIFIKKNNQKKKLKRISDKKIQFFDWDEHIYYKELNKFMYIMNITIKLQDFEKIINYSRNIICSYIKKGIKEIKIKANCNNIKNACKFICYYYNIEPKQEFCEKNIIFSCCQYRLNKHNLTNVEKIKYNDHCYCKSEKNIKNHNVKLIKKNENYYYYEYKKINLVFVFIDYRK